MTEFTRMTIMQRPHQHPRASMENGGKLATGLSHGSDRAPNTRYFDITGGIFPGFQKAVLSSAKGKPSATRARLNFFPFWAWDSWGRVMVSTNLHGLLFCLQLGWLWNVGECFVGVGRLQFRSILLVGYSEGACLVCRLIFCGAKVPICK